MQNNKLLAVMALTVAPLVTAQAAPSAPPTLPHATAVSADKPASSFADLAKLAEEIAVLKARLAKLELETLVAKKQSELQSLSVPAYSRIPPPVMPVITQPAMQPPPLAMTVMPEVAQGDPDALPRIESIDGIDGKLTINFIYPGNNRITAKVGDSLLSGWVVSAATLSSVTITRGTVTRQVPFGESAPEKSGRVVSGHYR